MKTFNEILHECKIKSFGEIVREGKIKSTRPIQVPNIVIEINSDEINHFNLIQNAKTEIEKQKAIMEIK